MSEVLTERCDAAIVTALGSGVLTDRFDSGGGEGFSWSLNFIESGLEVFTNRFGVEG